MMILDVANQHDEDIMSLRTTHDIALALCTLCVGGYYKQGGTTPVWPRGVVRISVYGTEPMTEENTEPAASQPSHVIERQVESRNSGMSIANTSNANLEDG